MWINNRSGPMWMNCLLNVKINSICINRLKDYQQLISKWMNRM